MFSNNVISILSRTLLYSLLYGLGNSGIAKVKEIERSMKSFIGQNYPEHNKCVINSPAPLIIKC